MNEPAAVYLPPSELRPWADNPRKNDQAVDAVADSIGRFGFGNPIVAWKPDDPLVIAGHTRLKASGKLGLEVVPVRFMPHLSLEEAKALAIADNKLNELADWDDRKLAAQVAALVEEGVDVSGLGFSDAELRELAASLEPEPEDPGAPEPPEEPVSKRGEVYELGPHRLMCGDSTSEEDVALLLDGAKPSLCLTDPPYGVGLDYADHNDTDAALARLARAWHPLWSALAPTVFSPGIHQQWHYPRPDWVICWFYGGGQNRSPWGFNCWQPFLCYGGDPSLAAGRGARPDAVDMNVPADPAVKASTGHPCPKPVQLWEWLLNRLSFGERDVIADPFIGSGTTLIAAAKTGRICYGMEISPAYCDVIRTRWGEYALKNGLEPGPDALLAVSPVG